MMLMKIDIFYYKCKIYNQNHGYLKKTSNNIHKTFKANILCEIFKVDS